MNPIRIAHIMPFPNIGGTEKATLRLAEAAAHCGFENTVYCASNAEPVRCFYHKNAFSTATYEQIEPSYHNPLPYLKAARSLAQDMKRRHVRIVHCADVLGAHYAALAGRLAGAFVMSHVRCEHSQISGRDQTFLFPVQRFVFVSKSTWQSFAMTVPEYKGQVLYEGIAETDVSTGDSAEARRHYGLPTDGFVIGMASRVHPCKDFETLIRAAKVIGETRSDCRYLIAGDHEQTDVTREYFQQLKRMLSELGLAQKFIFAGFEPEMRRFFAAVDVVVLSSHSEGMPLGVLEAMSAEKPVVATDVGGTREAIRDGETGLLVPHADANALASALLTLLNDRETRSSMAVAARETVMRNFGEKPFQKRVREMYCSIAKQQRFEGSYAPCMPM
jgi:glycosyltransferase involved in cell wall biosynthesis